MRRRPLQAVVNRPQQLVQTLSVPAPFGGWNTRDSVSDMAQTDAVLLKNCVVFPGKVSVRKGATNHATSFPSGKTIQSLMPYTKAGGAKLFAATDAAIYDATSAGAIGAAVQSGLTNGKWQHVNFSNSANHFLIAVNATDSMRQWDGSAWTTVATLGAINTTEYSDIAVYQQRLFFAKKNTLEVHYLATGAITGAPNILYFGQLFRRGGYVQALSSWTIDAGDGTDDKFVVVSSEGEVAVYSGTDPSSPTTWELNGVFFIGRPIGRRCVIKYAGDLLILTDRGLFPLSKALQSSTVDQTQALTDKIQPTFVYQSSTLFNTFGWEICINTNESFLLVNVPATSGAIQYVMHLQTMAWSEFNSWDASCWAYYDGNLYYGTLEKVVKAYFGPSDFGSNINADMVPAYNYWGSRGQQKHVKMLRPVFSADGPFGYGLAGCTDFTLTEPIGVIAPVTSTTALWGVALWGVAVWGSGVAITRRWQTVANNPHSAFAPFIRIATNTVQPSLLSIDYTVETGGVL